VAAWWAAAARRARIRCTGTPRLDEGDGEDGDREEDGHERVGVAGEIEVEHDVFLPFSQLDDSRRVKV
jgi:hypothetical protein